MYQKQSRFIITLEPCCGWTAEMITEYLGERFSRVINDILRYFHCTSSSSIQRPPYLTWRDLRAKMVKCYGMIDLFSVLSLEAHRHSPWLILVVLRRVLVQGVVGVLLSSGPRQTRSHHAWGRGMIGASMSVPCREKKVSSRGFFLPLPHTLNASLFPSVVRYRQHMRGKMVLRLCGGADGRKEPIGANPEKDSTIWFHCSYSVCGCLFARTWFYCKD